MKTATLKTIAVALGLACAGGAAANGSGEPRQVCRDIRAEMHELATQENCTSPVGFCAAGTIEGNFGLEGTTFFSVDAGAATPVESPGTSSYTGLFTITTPHGTLTLRETGISYPRRGNPEGGFIASLAEVQSGTGRYRSTTGVLFFHGTNGRGLPNDIEVSGRLCSATTPRR